MPIRQQFRKIFSRKNDTPSSDGAHEQLKSVSPANISVSYISEASLPERLWDQAYDSLKIQDAELVQAYEKILSRNLHGQGQGFNAPVTDSEMNVIAQDNVHTRRTQMQQLINEGLNKIAREAKIKESIGTGTQFIFSAKDIISSAIQAAPQAALAWTGACVALEVTNFHDKYTILPSSSIVVTIPY